MTQITLNEDVYYLGVGDFYSQFGGTIQPSSGPNTVIVIITQNRGGNKGQLEMYGYLALHISFFVFIKQSILKKKNTTKQNKNLFQGINHSQAL